MLWKTPATTPTLAITNTRPEHAPQIRALLERLNDLPDDDYFQVEHLCQHIARFAEGQFVALLGETVVGFAITQRTHYSPYARPLSWDEAVGDLSLSRHQPRGEWLYGVDFAVAPEYRGHGIGSQMYQARFNLVKRLNLRGFYAGGMLHGYHRYADQMSLREYGLKVMRGEIKDPTVTMQIKQGFRPRAIIENYAEHPPSANGAMLIVWENPAYQPTPVARPAAAGAPLPVGLPQPSPVGV